MYSLLAYIIQVNILLAIIYLGCIISYCSVLFSEQNLSP